MASKKDGTTTPRPKRAAKPKITLRGAAPPPPPSGNLGFQVTPIDGVNVVPPVETVPPTRGTVPDSPALTNQYDQLMERINRPLSEPVPDFNRNAQLDAEVRQGVSDANARQRVGQVNQGLRQAQANTDMSARIGAGTMHSAEGPYTGGADPEKIRSLQQSRQQQWLNNSVATDSARLRTPDLNSSTLSRSGFPNAAEARPTGRMQTLRDTLGAGQQMVGKGLARADAGAQAVANIAGRLATPVVKAGRTLKRGATRALDAVSGRSASTRPGYSGPSSGYNYVPGENDALLRQLDDFEPRAREIARNRIRKPGSQAALYQNLSPEQQIIVDTQEKGLRKEQAKTLKEELSGLTQEDVKRANELRAKAQKANTVAEQNALMEERAKYIAQSKASSQTTAMNKIIQNTTRGMTREGKAITESLAKGVFSGLGLNTPEDLTAVSRAIGDGVRSMSKQLGRTLTAAEVGQLSEALGTATRNAMQGAGKGLGNVGQGIAAEAGKVFGTFAGNIGAGMSAATEAAAAAGATPGATPQTPPPGPQPTGPAKPAGAPANMQNDSGGRRNWSQRVGDGLRSLNPFSGRGAATSPVVEGTPPVAPRGTTLRSAAGAAGRAFGIPGAVAMLPGMWRDYNRASADPNNTALDVAGEVATGAVGNLTGTRAEQLGVSEAAAKQAWDDSPGFDKAMILAGGAAAPIKELITNPREAIPAAFNWAGTELGELGGMVASKLRGENTLAANEARQANESRQTLRSGRAVPVGLEQGVEVPMSSPANTPSVAPPTTTPGQTPVQPLGQAPVQPPNEPPAAGSLPMDEPETDYNMGLRSATGIPNISMIEQDGQAPLFTNRSDAALGITTRAGPSQNGLKGGTFNQLPSRAITDLDPSTKAQLHQARMDAVRRGEPLPGETSGRGGNDYFRSLAQFAYDQSQKTGSYKSRKLALDTAKAEHEWAMAERERTQKDTELRNEQRRIEGDEMKRVTEMLKDPAQAGAVRQQLYDAALGPETHQGRMGRAFMMEQLLKNAEPSLWNGLGFSSGRGPIDALWDKINKQSPKATGTLTFEQFNLADDGTLTFTDEKGTVRPFGNIEGDALDDQTRSYLKMMIRKDQAAAQRSR